MMATHVTAPSFLGGLWHGEQLPISLQVSLAILSSMCCSIAVNGLLLMLASASVSPYGTMPLAVIGVPFGFFLALMSLTWLPIAVFSGLLRWTRWLTVLAATWYLVNVPATILSVQLVRSIRIKAFEQLAARSVPLINAIKQFDAKNGSPPKSLSDLVPEFLPEIPHTQIGAYPEYHYLCGESAETEHFGNRWILVVPCPLAFLNGDWFLYYPSQNYPERAHGGWLERVGEWAYVHE